MTENKDADAERVSDIVARLRRGERFYVSATGPVYSGPTELHTAAADIIEAQSKALAEARAALKDARTELFEAEDKFWVIHCNHPGHSADLGELSHSQEQDKEFCATMSKRMNEAAKRVGAALTPTPENPNG